MNCIKLPRWAEELIKCFVGFPERVQYYLDAVEVVEASDVKSSQWIVQLCAPTSDDIATLIENPASVYTHPSFVRLLYRDNTYKDFRDRHVRLVDALEAQSSRLVVEEFLDHLTELSAEDRARSFLLLASEIPSDETGQEEDEERIEWLTRIVASFPTSPRALRPQLLLAASIIGHTPMVTLLLRDIATDDDPAPNIDAVEAECLIEAAVNQHFEIVKELLDGGRFSNGNETRWDAVVQALEVSCSNGAADITDILLPHYLSYCSVISACGVHHPRLHRLALSNWHFEIVEMLLECDPRGTLCNMMELIDTLREEVALSAQEPADTAASSGMLSIIGGEENDDMGDLIMWDAAALARGVSSEDNTLVKFLVNHVGFCPEALEAALATALESGNRELVDIISRPLQKMTDPCDEQDGGEEKEEEEEYERIDSPCPTDLINDEPTEGKTDSGEHGSHDRCQNPTNVDGDNATMALDVLPDVSRPPSAAKLMAARTMSFNEVEQIMSTATQSAVTRKTDDNLLKVTEDKDIDTESTQDDFLSSHFTEVEEVEAAQDNALSHSTEVEADASTKLENDTLTGLQKIDDTSFTAMSVLLRQISSNTVDRVLREGTLVVMQHEVKEHTEASAARQSDAMLTSDGRKYERAITPYEVAAFEIPEGDSFNSKSETTSLTPVGSEEAIALVERERSENQGVIPCESSAGSDTAKIDEAVVNTIVTGDDLAVDDGSLTSSVDTMDVTLEQENCTEVSVHELPVPVLPPPIAIPPSKFLGSTGELKNVDDASVLRRSDSDKDADTERCTSQDHLALPQVVVSPVRTPLTSPTRSTIICPVKWVEHAAETSESSNLDVTSSVPLHEGDRVEVHYKGRPILFPGVVIFCHSSGVYDIVYEDGEEETCVSRQLIQLVESVQQPNDSTAQNDHDEEPEAVIRDEQVGVDGSSEPTKSNGGSLLDWDEGCSPTATPANGVSDHQLNRLDADDGRNDEVVQGGPNMSGASDSNRQYQDTQAEQLSTSFSFKLPGDNETSSIVDKALGSTFKPQCGYGVSAPAQSANDAPSVSETDQEVEDNAVEVEHLPEIPSIVVPSTARTISGKADTISSEDVTEWKNVDLLLTRKRRLFQTQTGSGESIKVPWGEEFATIQSLKRFAAQYPDVLRAHIATQLRELDGPLSNGSPRKPRSPRSRNPSAHSGAGQARGALLLIKDLAFLLQHRLAPFFDTIVPVVLPTVFSSEKRFLCETATEVLDAIILHCSGRKLALLFLQLGDKYDRHQDLRLYNLTSIYVEKCVRNWSKAEFSSLHASQSSTQLLTLLAKTLMSKSAPVRISAQKTFRHLRDELGRRNFEVVLRAHVSPDLESLVLKECGGGAAPAPSDRKRSRKHHERRVDTQSNSVSNPTIVQGSPSILQRMLLHRQNRVLPAQT
ncbi:hypothetical protein PF007_g13606 [Phytophthora fragariae]|uniref:Tudor domain-containing protein n=1 Tax=Phytophthora fragariae TaxID=53985 RepID=A0A6A3S518_9STRA|nr:hypothetical protein PF009_g13179 [Phytophthora fragariae]KAE9105873.1 hypothetical protein PF007_g13606 [Phytophthora fragariae]